MSLLHLFVFGFGILKSRKNINVPNITPKYSEDLVCVVIFAKLSFRSNQKRLSDGNE